MQNSNYQPRESTWVSHGPEKVVSTVKGEPKVIEVKELPSRLISSTA